MHGVFGVVTNTPLWYMWFNNYFDKFDKEKIRQWWATNCTTILTSYIPIALLLLIWVWYIIGKVRNRIHKVDTKVSDTTTNTPASNNNITFITNPPNYEQHQAIVDRQIKQNTLPNQHAQFNGYRVHQLVNTPNQDNSNRDNVWTYDVNHIFSELTNITCKINGIKVNLSRENNSQITAITKQLADRLKNKNPQLLQIKNITNVIIETPKGKIKPIGTLWITIELGNGCYKELNVFVLDDLHGHEAIISERDLQSVQNSNRGIIMEKPNTQPDALMQIMNAQTNLLTHLINGQSRTSSASPMVVGNSHVQQPKSFNKTLNVDDWIKGVETFMKVSNITSNQRETMWSYIDVDTIEILKKISFSDHPTLGYEQLKEKMHELFGKEEEHTID